MKKNLLIEKYLGEGMKEKIENNIRDHLSGNDRYIDKNGMWMLVKTGIKNVDEKMFNKVWDELIDDDYLIKTKKSGFYKWEM